MTDDPAQEILMPDILPPLVNLIPQEWSDHMLPEDLTVGMGHSAADTCGESVAAFPGSSIRYVCTLPVHTGAHVAGDGERIVAIWANQREA